MEGKGNNVYLHMVPGSWHGTRARITDYKGHMDRPEYPLFKIYVALPGKQTQK